MLLIPKFDLTLQSLYVMMYIIPLLECCNFNSFDSNNLYGRIKYLQSYILLDHSKCLVSGPMPAVVAFFSLLKVHVRY